MNASKFYKTRSKKALDKIAELEKQLTAMTADRDNQWRISRSRQIDINDMKLRINAMQTSVEGHRKYNDELLTKNKELVAQIRELEKLEIDEPVNLVPVEKCENTDDKYLNINIGLTGNYMVEFVDEIKRVIGVAK